MPKILFWNVNSKDLRDLVCDAVRAEQCDVVILIENGSSEEATLASLKSQVSEEFARPNATVGRFQLFSQERSLDLSQVLDDGRATFRRLRLSDSELLLGIVHFVDARNFDDPQRQHEVTMLIETLTGEEDRAGHDRTILLGDFNMNPFDRTMNLAAGVNAMMTVECTKRKQRTVQRRGYSFFYNPMWSLFGDLTEGPAGTYYHANSAKGHYGWNMLDQVVLRPAACEWFEGVTILSRAGETSLVNSQGRPDTAKASDHLPLVVTLKRGEE